MHHGIYMTLQCSEGLMYVGQPDQSEILADSGAHVCPTEAIARV